jgi:aspartyl-tRNA(Asn)/glutamyl-tRNA(Gln) amidotransferase subunit A
VIDLSRLSAAHIREGVVQGEFTAREVTEASLDRIDALDEQVHAFLQLTPDLALAAADAVDARRAAAAACLPDRTGRRKVDPPRRGRA